MDIRDYLAAFRRRWVIIAAAAVVGLLAALIVTAMATPQYKATARLFVTTASGSSVSDAYQGNLFLQDRIASYAKVATGRQVAEKSVQELDVKLSPDQLRSMISAEPITDSVLLDITATTSNPELSRDAANVVAGQTAAAIKELETSARGGLPTASATILDAAETPSDPSSPSWPRNLALGLFAGLVIGIIGALVREFTDSRVRSGRDLESASGAPSLGDVGTPKGDGAHGEAVTPAYESVFDALLGEGVTPGSRVLVTSPDDSGTTASRVAHDLAAAMATERDPVVVIETDHRRTPATAQAGLFDVLDGATALPDATLPTDRPGLYVIAAGTADGGARTDLLASDEMTEVMKELSVHFRYIMLVSAPVTAYPDAVVMKSISDGTVLVCTNGTTTKKTIADAADRLRNSGMRVIGTVLSGSSPRILI